MKIPQMSLLSSFIFLMILNSELVNSKSQQSENNSKLLTLHSIYPHTLTLALTTETPIHRAFQAACEGVRAKNKKNFFRFLEVNELTSYIINNKAISPFPFCGNEDMADVL